MAKFSPSDIEALLHAKAPAPDASDLPDEFFDDMQARILSAAAAENDAQSAERAGSQRAAIVPMPQRRTFRMWKASAAAAVIVCLSVIAIRYHQNQVIPDNHDCGIYAVAEDATEGDIEQLDDLFEADIFLENL